MTELSPTARRMEFEERQRLREEASLASQRARQVAQQKRGESWPTAAIPIEKPW